MEGIGCFWFKKRLELYVFFLERIRFERKEVFGFKDFLVVELGCRVVYF